MDKYFDFDIENTVSVYDLKFGPDSPYHGLHVQVAGMTIGEYNEMLRRAADAVRSKTDAERAEANLASNEHIRECFYRHIRDWNLTRKGVPLPISTEVMDALDSRLSTVLVRNWLDALTDVPEDLEGKSSSGGPSEEQSMMLASSSSNHSNSPKPN